MLTSLNQNWRTPKKIYEELNKEFKFDYDPCPPPAFRKGFFDGILNDWGKSNLVKKKLNQ